MVAVTNVPEQAITLYQACHTSYRPFVKAVVQSDVEALSDEALEALYDMLDYTVQVGADGCLPDFDGSAVPDELWWAMPTYAFADVQSNIEWFEHQLRVGRCVTNRMRIDYSNNIRICSGIRELSDSGFIYRPENDEEPMRFLVPLDFKDDAAGILCLDAVIACQC